MSDRIFMDTNIWIYLYSDDTKSEIAEHLINRYFEHIVISTQVLGECFSILTKKRIKTSEEAKEIVNDMAMAYLTIGIDWFSVLKALDIHTRYQYAYYDSLIIASALERNCSILYTEDMQHDQIIEHQLRIIDPFR